MADDKRKKKDKWVPIKIPVGQKPYLADLWIDDANGDPSAKVRALVQAFDDDTRYDAETWRDPDNAFALPSWVVQAVAEPFREFLAYIDGGGTDAHELIKLMGLRGRGRSQWKQQSAAESAAFDRAFAMAWVIYASEVLDEPMSPNEAAQAIELYMEENRQEVPGYTHSPLLEAWASRGVGALAILREHQYPLKQWHEVTRAVTDYQGNDI